MQFGISARAAHQFMESQERRQHEILLQHLEGLQHAGLGWETAGRKRHIRNRRIVFQYSDISDVRRRRREYISPRLEVMSHRTTRHARLLGDLLCGGLGVADINQATHGGIEDMQAHEMALLRMPTTILGLHPPRRSAQLAYLLVNGHLPVHWFHLSEATQTAGYVQVLCRLPASGKKNKQFFN